MEITTAAKPFIRRGWPNTFGNIVYMESLKDLYDHNHSIFTLYWYFPTPFNTHSWRFVSKFLYLTFYLTSTHPHVFMKS